MNSDWDEEMGVIGRREEGRKMSLKKGRCWGEEGKNLRMKLRGGGMKKVEKVRR